MNSDEPICVTQALAHVFDCCMSKIDYEKHCKLVNRSKRILPPYFWLEAEKLKCRPPGVEANPHEVKVPLQSLLDHTVQRLLEFQDIQEQLDRLTAMNDGDPPYLELIFKYGFDGTTVGKFKQLSDDLVDPGKLFASNLVILQLVTFVKGRIFILYDNGLCNSSVSVRAIHHQYVKETTEVVKMEDERLEAEINALEKFEWTESIKIGYIAIKSILDGKCINICCENDSSQRCPFCLCGPKDFNSLVAIFRADPDLLAQLCLSVLHFGLRVIDLLFNIGFNQDFQCHQCRGEENKLLRSRRRAMIMKKFKDIGY